MKLKEYRSLCGNLLLGVHAGKVCLCDWMVGDRTERTLRRINRFLQSEQNMADEALLAMTVSLLDEYFKGKIKEIDLPLKFYGTEFQQSVWQALQRSPYGETVSYKDIAEHVGRPGSVRAVANAIGANPLSILVPCHRVIGSNGRLTGYAGGLEAKKYLLELERQWGR